MRADCLRVLPDRVAAFLTRTYESNQADRCCVPIVKLVKTTTRDTTAESLHFAHLHSSSHDLSREDTGSIILLSIHA